MCPLLSRPSSAGDPQNVLAAANEEGIVRIYNTESRENPLLKGRCRDCLVFLFFYNGSVHVQEISVANGVCMSAEWLAHENAVFDIAWVPGESHLVSTIQSISSVHLNE